MMLIFVENIAILVLIVAIILIFVTFLSLTATEPKQITSDV